MNDTTPEKLRGWISEMQAECDAGKKESCFTTQDDGEYLRAQEVRQLVAVAAIAIVGVILFIGIRAIHRRWHPLRRPQFRLWLVGAAAWPSSVVLWAAVYGRGSDLETSELFILGVAPPVLAGLILLGLSWATGPRSSPGR